MLAHPCVKLNYYIKHELNLVGPFCIHINWAVKGNLQKSIQIYIFTRDISLAFEQGPFMKSLGMQRKFISHCCQMNSGDARTGGIECCYVSSMAAGVRTNRLTMFLMSSQGTSVGYLDLP